VQNPLATKLLSGEIEEGSQVILDAKNGELVWSTKKV